MVDLARYAVPGNATHDWRVVLMTKLLLIALVLFCVVLVWPELRPLLFVGGFCWVTGFMVGTRHRAKHDAELVTARLVRGAQTWQAE